MQRQLIAIAAAAAASAALSTGAAHAQPAPAPAPSAQPLPPEDPPPPQQQPPPATGADGAAPGAAGDAASPTGPATGAPTATDPGSGALRSIDEDVGDQAISVELGLAAGGRLTPGGLRIAGQFIYQLSDEDWFDGAASFTFGSGGAACFRDRVNRLICSHGVSEGTGVELSASIRRMFKPQGVFHPFAKVGVGLGLVRFSDDDVSGITIPAHGGGGIRITMTPSIGVLVEGEVALGFGSFSREVGSQPQLGIAIAGGVEFRLR